MTPSTSSLTKSRKKSGKARTKHRRVLMICHNDLVPPDSIRGLSDEDISEWRTEFDVLSTMRDLNYEIEVLGVGDDIDVIRKAIEGFKPEVCFNLIVEFLGAANYDQHVVSYLELHRQPYTGCNPRGLTLSRDKALSKKVLAWHGLPVPKFGVFPINRRVRRPKELEFPLFIKSLNEEASLGISQASIVHDDTRLEQRVRFIHEKVGTDAIAEEYIEGREFYIGILGNDRLEALPLWELNIPNLPEGAPRIATRRLKWDIPYQRSLKVKNRRATDLSVKLEASIQRAAKDVYRALGLSGFARLDLRMRPDGRFYFLEANPNPDLTYGEDFAESAEAAGIPYETLIERIVELGVRYPVEWRHGTS